MFYTDICFFMSFIFHRKAVIRMSSGKWKTEEEKMAQMEAQKKLLEHRIKNYERNSKSLTRKARTHQLCTYGGMLEKYFPDIVYLPDVEVNSFLSILSKMPEVQKVLQEVSDTNYFL